ncbi:MAG: capsule biosynthesis protein [Jannaschia helgolandensis]
MNTQADGPTATLKKPRSKRQRALEQKRLREKQIEAAILPPAEPARVRGRHWAMVLGFVLVVCLPVVIAGWYLTARAADQFASFAGFTVRQATQTAPAVEILGGLTDISGTSTADTDILYNFLFSQELVRTVDDRIDLRAMWSLPQNDPVFAFDPDGTIEDLVHYWRRMTTVSYDSGTGLLEVRVLAFTAENAQRINQTLFEISTETVNDLNAVARSDATRYAAEDLQNALDRLKDARTTLTAFRNDNRLVDPNSAIQGQVGILNTLQAQLAEALIELDLLGETTRNSDPRVTQARRKIEVIRTRIEDERNSLGFNDNTGEASAFATIVGEYEGLIVDLEFAEQSYTSALSTYDSAVADANRQSRYLAAYLGPTIAERAEYPRRAVLLGLLTLFLVLGWALLVLGYYSLKDRQARL